MRMETDLVVQILLRERLQLAAVAAAIVRDTHAADDIFQQVVLSALEHRGEFRGPDHLFAWAVRATRHRAIDLARQRHLRSLPDVVLDLIEADWANPAGAGEPTQVEALHGCLQRLPAATQHLLRLRYTDGLSAAAIAARLRRSTDAVYQALSRTHRQLRECIERKLALDVRPAPAEVRP